MELGQSHIKSDIFSPDLEPNLVNVLTGFIRNEAERFGIKKCVIGLSGGVDSAVAAFLAQQALGEKNVIALLIPYKESSKDSITDALHIARQLKIKSKVIDITRAVDAFLESGKDPSKVRKGNIIARMRMIALYDYSNEINGLVIGTGNKTEILLGYTTIFGDNASAINPLGDLYKTQVLQLAKLLGVPSKLIGKKPSADLWIGQSDESELGFTYKRADELLFYMVDLRYNDTELKELGFRADFIKKIRMRIRKNQFKRLPPVIAKVSNRTINVDFRYNRDNYS